VAIEANDRKREKNLMPTAYDVMTRAVATCTPDTPVRQVAAQMRDLNIGDVLVVENGNLRGIVTDRDLAVNAMTKGVNPDKTPVDQFMTTDVVTGQPDWSVEHIAQVMGKHQVRRLPIVQDNQLIGIVSLGDVALHSSKQQTVGESLKSISDSTRARFNSASPFVKFIGLAVPVALGAVVLLAANTKQGRRFAKQIEDSNLPEKAGQLLQATQEALQDPETRQAALDMAQQAREQAGEISSRVSEFARRAPQKKALFA